MERIHNVGFTPAEARAVVGLLLDKKTHQQAATASGVSRAASKQRVRRARLRARRHGIVIPHPRRTYIVQSIAQATARGAA